MANQNEQWVVNCPCGTKFDDHKRMVICDICKVWMHTGCVVFDENKDFHCQLCRAKNPNVSYEDLQAATVLVNFSHAEEVNEGATNAGQEDLVPIDDSSPALKKTEVKKGAKHWSKGSSSRSKERKTNSGQELVKTDDSSPALKNKKVKKEAKHWSKGSSSRSEEGQTANQCWTRRPCKDR